MRIADQPRTYRCNLKLRPPRKSDGKIGALWTFGPDMNVHVEIENVVRRFQYDLDGRIADLVDIAAFVYAADSVSDRGRSWKDDAIESWSRNIKFEIGVRDPGFWERTDVIKLLSETLGFLSDDRFTFRFERLTESQFSQRYLNLGINEDWPFQSPDRVVLFSGGLDSLAGSVMRAAQGHPLVLVSHRSISTMDQRQRNLFEALCAQYPSVPMLRVPVWINKAERLGSREHNQRTRSFLFWALAVAIGKSIDAGGVQFFENGVVSLNLPIADQVLRARASRTTHPIALRGMEQLAELILERKFPVENPFLFKTKTEVVETLIAHGAQDLVRHSCSCTRTRLQRGIQWHCGCCSQCIDRRIATIAAGVADHDPEMDYGIDVMTGARNEAADQMMAINYVRHGIELARASPDGIATRFNAEISRATVSHSPRSAAARELVEMHLRHGAVVEKVVTAQLAQHQRALLNGELDRTSLLGLAVDRRHLEPVWRAMAERIGTILSAAIPIAYRKKKPDNEARLQETCDAVLQGHDDKLVREYPFIRWATRSAKPDLSEEHQRLWVELKYVKDSPSVRRITEEVAADVTKYGDSGRHTLFVVYDPHHEIAPVTEFVRDIERHGIHAVRVIR